jgi:hypothetical protein
MNETLQLVNYKDILGKRAYFAKEDRFAGSVKDIMFLLDEKKAVALLLERGLLPLVKPAVLFTDIQDIKNDRILIKSGSSMMSVKELKKSYNDCTLGNYLGKKVCSKTGQGTSQCSGSPGYAKTIFNAAFRSPFFFEILRLFSRFVNSEKIF